MPADIKDVLYSVINEIGRERVRMDIAADIKTSETYCKEIVTKCARRRSHKVDDETLVTL